MNHRQNRSTFVALILILAASILLHIRQDERTHAELSARIAALERIEIRAAAVPRFRPLGR